MNTLGRDNKEKSKKSNVFSRETLGVVLILFATLALVCLITREKVFSAPGKAINAFLLGTFGYFSYLLLAWVIYKGVMLFAGKKIKLKKNVKILIALTVGLTVVLVHAITMSAYSKLPYGEYLSKCYTMADGGIATSSGGGIIAGLITYWLTAILSNVGVYVVASVGLAITFYFIGRDIYKSRQNVSGKNQLRSSYVKTPKDSSGDAVDLGEINISGVKDYPVNIGEQTSSTQKLFVNNPGDFALKNKREMKKTDEGIKITSQNGLNVGTTAKSATYSKSYQDDLREKLNYVKIPPKIDIEEQLGYKRTEPTGEGTSISETVANVNIEENQTENENPLNQNIPLYLHDEENPETDGAEKRAEEFGDYANIEDVEQPVNYIEPEEKIIPLEERNAVKPEIEEERDSGLVDEEEYGLSNESDEESLQKYADKIMGEQEPSVSPIVKDERLRDILGTRERKAETSASANVNTSESNFTSRVSIDGNLRSRRSAIEPPKEYDVEEEKPMKQTMPLNYRYVKPSTDLLKTHRSEITGEEDHEGRKNAISQMLSEFHIDVEMKGHVQGPSITRYEFQMPQGVSVKKVFGFEQDMGMRLETKSGVRIAPIPGANLVGVEVANKFPTIVGLKEIMEDNATINKFKNNALMFALGKDIVGNSIFDDIVNGPHFLVAGATGSGKSVCLNVMIISLIMRYSPEDLRLVLIDPKGNEFIPYEHLPHLMIDEIINEPKKAVAALAWAIEEMERRYKTLAACGGIRDISVYNEMRDKKTPKMPRIVIIIDELSNLMMQARKDMENMILSIAQKARAVGIHLILATQRPSVDVITGTIKANLNSRIALKVNNAMDSITIMNEGGADALLGHGDMLYKNNVMSNYTRYQGAWIDDREINAIVSFIKENNQGYYDDDMKEYLENAVRPPEEPQTSGGGSGEEDGQMNEADNNLFLKALSLAINTGMISISQIQRRFQVGYAKAGRFIDNMERCGYITQNEGAKARKVLITREQFEEKYGPMPD